jgi:hypothetical protein
MRLSFFLVPGSLFLAGLTMGCGPTNVGDYPRNPVNVAAVASPSGWTSVEEPGWFVASTPGAPKTTYETIHLDDALLHVKGLSSSDGQTVWTWIRYFEVSQLTTMLDTETLARAARDDFLAIEGVHFLREEPRRAAGPTFDFVCDVDPHSPLDPSGRAMIARVRGYKHMGPVSRIVFAIAVWPKDESDATARTFFEGFRVTS